jgi:hypothetical protein
MRLGDGLEDVGFGVEEVVGEGEGFVECGDGFVDLGFVDDERWGEDEVAHP